MKFEVRAVGNFWEVGFFNPSGKWVNLSAFNNKSEADAECSRLIGGNR